jgi:hypothetical protein
MNKYIFETPFELVDEAGANEAFASVSLNPTFRWCKFILTDDQPNLNKNRIPLEEFENLIKSGIHAPIKMAYKNIKDGHDESFPLGTITSLQQEGNVIKGLAALWSMERESDVEQIKKRFDEGLPLNLSWEVLYKTAEEEENGVFALKDTVLTATTLVGMPAYAGRTPILQVASVQNSEELTLELEELKQKNEELQASVLDLTTRLDEVTAKNEELSQFKASIEAVEAEKVKLAAIREKFVQAGIEKSEDYFTGNKEKLLGMSEDQLDFILQELVSFVPASASVTDPSTVTVPVIVIEDSKLSPKELGKKFRE